MGERFGKKTKQKNLWVEIQLLTKTVKERKNNSNDNNIHIYTHTHKESIYTYVFIQEINNTIVYYPPTDAQLVLEQHVHPGQLPCFITISHDDIWYGISFWPVQVCCPDSVLYQFLVPPQAPLLAEQYENLKN